MDRQYMTPTQRSKRLLDVGLKKFGSKAAYARALRMDPTNLNKSLLAKNPQIKTLIRYAKANDVGVEVFIYE